MFNSSENQGHAQNHLHRLVGNAAAPGRKETSAQRSLIALY